MIESQSGCLKSFASSVDTSKLESQGFRKCLNRSRTTKSGWWVGVKRCTTLLRSVGSRCHSMPTMVELGREVLDTRSQGNPCRTCYPIVFKILKVILRQDVFWHQNCHF